MPDPVHPRAGGSEAPPDDLARALPAPPPPRPALRTEAIASALERFDGVGTTRPVETPPTARRVQGWWLAGRTRAAALASAALVALIGVPLTLQHPDGRPGPPSTPASSPGAQMSVAQPTPVAPVEGDRAPAADLGAVEHAEPATLAVKPAPNRPALSASPAEPGELIAAAPPSARAPAPAPPPPPASPPPAQVAPEALADVMGAAQRAAAAEDSTSNIVVTGSRIPRRAKVRSRRGDWNACTLADPEQTLRGCSGLIRTGAKGAAGAAGAQVAEGLALGWKGDLDSAIAAFDKAIAVQPRLGIAHLNRALAHERHGALDKALADLDQAVRLDPSARSYYARSRARRDSGDVVGARSDARRAVELDPDYARVLED